MNQTPRLTSLAAGALLLGAAGCATPKVPVAEAFGPELTVHTVPPHAEVFRQGKSLGLAPVDIPIAGDDTQIALEARQGGFLPAQVTINADGLRKAGGGETWVALKPDTLGTDTPALDGLSAKDLDRGGVALTKAKRCRDAEAFFVRALAMDPHFARTHRDRAWCLVHTHQRDRAATELELYLSQAPDAPDASAVRARIDALRKGHDILLGAKPEDP